MHFPGEIGFILFGLVFVVLFLVAIGAFIRTQVKTIRKAMKRAAEAPRFGAKEEAFFKVSFPELQPCLHPEKVLRFLMGMRVRARSDPWEWKDPDGLGVAYARFSAPSPKGVRVDLVDAAGVLVSRFLLQDHAEGHVIRIDPGKLTANLREKSVRYWHPEREFKWSRKRGWRVLTAVSSRPIETSERGLGFSSDSPSSSTSGGRSGAAAMAGGGGTFDGGGASASWGEGSESRTSY